MNTTRLSALLEKDLKEAIRTHLLYLCQSLYCWLAFSTVL